MQKSALVLLALPAAVAGGAVEVCRQPQPPLATATPSATRAVTGGIAHAALTSPAEYLLSLRAFPPPQLTKANFKELVTDSGKNAFVKFLAPW